MCLTPLLLLLLPVTGWLAHGQGPNAAARSCRDGGVKVAQPGLQLRLEYRAAGRCWVRRERSRQHGKYAAAGVHQHGLDMAAVLRGCARGRG
jgi:hypothetical protein